MKLHGSDIIMKCLIEQGVDVVFGYPGGQIIDVFDALYRTPEIKQILTAHEQGAAHAADGYARATGKVGVVIATSGPGATNLVTGIANAHLDSVPLVAITGNVPVSSLGRDSFQEVDIAGITMPITKHNYIVKRVEDLANVIREAFFIARSGRPGPVLVDVPKDVQQALYEYTPEPVREREVPEIQADVTEAIEIIKSAKRPFILAGGGCISSGASDELLKFAKRINAPVAVTVMGLGAIPASSPYYCGLIGMHGSAAVAKLMTECDVFIAFGTRFSDRVAANRANFCKNAKIVHIDIDSAEIRKNVHSEARIIGDVKNVLKVLNINVPEKSDDTFLKRAALLKSKNPLSNTNAKLSYRAILENLSNRKGDYIIATDVGQHQMWTVQTYAVEKPRTILTSGGLGTMGYGLGAAIGAAIGTGKRIVLITGDGSFHMNCNELMTAARLHLPITILLFNNHTLGMVRQWQTLFYNKHYSSTDLDLPTDYVKLAEAFGATGLSLDKNEDIDKVLNEALTLSPGLVNCRIETDEYVLPMIPPGKGVEGLITSLNADENGIKE